MSDEQEWEKKEFWKNDRKVRQSLKGLKAAIEDLKAGAASGESREKWLLANEVEDILERYKALS